MKKLSYFRYLTKPQILLLIVIIGIAIFFRFYNFPNRYGFDPDSTRDALITLYGSETHSFPLIGPRSSIGPFNFGPWYYYQLIIFRSLLPVSYAAWIYVSLVSVLFTFVMFKIGRELENAYFGLLLGFLTAISPAEIISGTGLSNPDLVPICAGLSIFLFIYLFKYPTKKVLFVIWGLILGIGINNHFQMGGFLIYPIIIFITKKDRLKIGGLFALGFLLSWVPLLLFQLTHHWTTFEGLFFYLREGRKLIYIPNSWSIYLKSFWPGFWAYVLGIPAVFSIFLIFTSTLIMTYLFFKKELKATYLFLLVGFIVQFLLLRFYGGERAYYDLQFLHPFIFILTGSLVYQLFTKNIVGKIIGVIILCMLIVFSLPVSLKQLQPMQSHKAYITAFDNLLVKYPTQPLVIYRCGNDDQLTAETLTFLLTTKNKFDSSSQKKIGILSKKCESPQASYLLEDKIVTISVVDISDYDEDSLHQAGWEKVTPEKVYKEKTNL